MDRTVLILGAGFSKPYKYPSGPELVELIIEKTLKSENPQFSKLAHDLRDHGDYSIDRFLSEHKQHEKPGITNIVAAISDAEKISSNAQAKDEDDIIRFLLTNIDTNDFKNLRIITFNYDRLLEWRILKKLQTRFSAEEAYSLFKHLKIEHVHGRMPFLKDLEFPKEGLVTPYDISSVPTISAEQHIKNTVQYGLANFKTIYTNTHEPNAFAVDAIKWAKRVFFLGFAYDSLNMTKLGINVEGTIYDWDGKYVAGTSLGMNPIRLKQIQIEYPFLENRLFPISAKSLFEHKFCLTNSLFDNEPTRNNVDKKCCESHAIQERPDGGWNVVGYSAEHTCKVCNRQFTAGYNLNSTSKRWTVSV